MTVGVAITLDRDADGGLTLMVPGLPAVLDRVIAAVRDGALVLTDPADQGLRELEALIMGERDRLLAQADALLARPVTRAAG